MLKDIQNLSTEQVEEKLSAIIALFCCLSGRDVFMSQYQQHLAYRILNNLVISTEAEELMLSKFRLELGINAVNKMTQMFKDVSLSKVLRKDYYVHKDCEPEV